MNTIKVKRIFNHEFWDEELIKFHGSLFLSRVWLDSLKNNDTIPIYLKFYKNKQVVGMLAGLVMPVGKSNKKQLFFYSGIAYKKPEKELNLSCKISLVDFSKENNFYRITIQSYDNTLFFLEKASGFIQTNHIVEYILDLTKSKEEIILGFNPDFLRNVKKAINKGLTFHHGYSIALLDQLLELAKQTVIMRENKGYGSYNIFGIHYLRPDALKILLQSKAAIIFYAMQNEEIVCMSCAYLWDGKAYGIVMGTSSHGYKIGAPSFQFHEIIFKLKELGFAVLNFGPVPKGSKNEGIKKFKMKMGLTPVESYEEITDFLLYPLKRLNFILLLKRHINRRRIPLKLKKMLFGFLNRISKLLILKGH